MTALPDMLWYWSVDENIAAYPRIAQAGAYTLSLGLTAVPCEAVFSAAGFANNGRRNRIGAKRLDMQLFERWNRGLGQPMVQIRK
jgi:hypothetical protein